MKSAFLIVWEENETKLKKCAECFDEKMMWFTYLHQGKCSLLTATTFKSEEKNIR